MNNCNLTGRITRDPEVRYTNSGTACLSFNLAVDKKQKDANGQSQANFIPCVAWGAIADFMGKYIKKGYMLAVKGSIQTRSYQAQDGSTKIVVEVIADEVENLTPRPVEQQPQTQHPQNPTYQAPQQPTQNQYGNNDMPW